MMSLFSSFDLWFYKSQLLFYFLLSILFFFNFYAKSFIFTALNFFKLELYKFVNSLSLRHSFSMMLLLLSTMTLILVLNFLSVFPYIFPFTSQLGTVFYFSFWFWFSFNLFSVIYNTKGFLLHFIPESCPSYLIPLLFLIEIVSSLIRPATLSIRLVANILAGHVLMILLSFLSMENLFGFLSYSVLNLIEFFVGVVQSYIYLTLLALYYSDL